MSDRLPQENSLKVSDLIESIDKETAFYRERLFMVYKSAIVLQVLVITGQQTIQLAKPLLSQVAYSAVFVLLLVFSVVFNSSYKQRIYDLRRAKIKLCNIVGYQDIFPEPGGPRSVSPSRLYLATISAMSVLALIIVWLGGIP